MLISVLAALVCALVLAGIVVAAVAAGRGHRAGARLLLVLAVVWLLVNKPLEIKILWTVAPGHGLVVADLLSPVLVVFAAWRLRAVPDVPAQPRHAGRAGVDDLLFGRTLDLDDPALDLPAPDGPTRPAAGHREPVPPEFVPWIRSDLDHDARIAARPAPGPSARKDRRSRLRGRSEPNRGRGAA